MSRFTKAKANAGTVTKKKTKKAAKPEYTIKGLRDYAAVTDTIKALEGLKATLKEDVHEQIAERFVEDGLNTHSKPVNFNGIDVGATGSCQLRKRTSRSALRPAELETLAEHGIDVESGGVVESDETVFYINKKYEGDEELMDSVSDALDKANVPEDFLLCAPSKFHTTDDAIRQAFAGAENAEDLTELLGIVGTIATRVKYEGGIKAALKVITEMMVD
jgi:hypothetical protein